MIDKPQSKARKHIAIVFHGFSGGGMETVMMRLGSGFLARGHSIEFVVKCRKGELVDRVPAGIPVFETGVELPSFSSTRRAETKIGKYVRRVRKAGLTKMIYMPRLAYFLRADPLSWRFLFSRRLEALRPLDRLEALPGLVGYLKTRRPDAVLAAEPHYNLMSVLAGRLARVPTRIVITEHLQPSKGSWCHSEFGALLRRGYHSADAIVSVSDGVGEELSSVAGIRREKIQTIYNPVVGPDCLALAEEPLDHPWFATNAPPVILAAGRIHPQKGISDLIRAFARIHAERKLRLVILGPDGHNCADYVDEVRRLPSELGIEQDVDIPGFVANPFKFMRRAAAFVLSSAYEGLGNVLIEAMACGCPVVSTDCPSGPREILDGGRYGALVPVGDDAAMAAAIAATLERPIDTAVLKARADHFSVDRAVDSYLRLLLPHVADDEPVVACQ